MRKALTLLIIFVFGTTGCATVDTTGPGWWGYIEKSTTEATGRTVLTLTPAAGTPHNAGSYALGGQWQSGSPNRVLLTVQSAEGVFSSRSVLELHINGEKEEARPLNNSAGETFTFHGSVRTEKSFVIDFHTAEKINNADRFAIAFSTPRGRVEHRFSLSASELNQYPDIGHAFPVAWNRFIQEIKSSSR